MKQTHREISRAVNAFLATFEADKVPHGFLTIEQWRPHFKVGTRQTQNILERFVKAGHCEKASYRVPAHSVIRPVMHYRLDPLAAKALNVHISTRSKR